MPEKEKLDFKSNGFLTLGAEVELQIIDQNSLNLAPKSDSLLEAGKSIKNLKPEFYLNTVEINTDICSNAHEINEDLSNSIKKLDQVAQPLEIQLATTGCHPFSRYSHCVITPSKRYSELIDRNQWLTRRMTVYGLHVHIGMRSGDECIDFNNFFSYFTCHLLALSASSPFWQGNDTGLSSCRPTTYEALPTAGQPYYVKDWQEFENIYNTLKKCDSIESLKDLWWDTRPSPEFGTLEIRVCDGVATSSETAAIVAYIHLLAHWFSDNPDYIKPDIIPSYWMTRENKWRAMRHGLEASVVTNANGDTADIKDNINKWIEKLSPYTEQLGYETYIKTLKDILNNGNSSSRQRSIYNETNSLEEVVKFNIEEFKKGQPIFNRPREVIQAAL